jgi:predicted O-methyltransferase YrrM
MCPNLSNGPAINSYKELLKNKSLKMLSKVTQSIRARGFTPTAVLTYQMVHNRIQKVLFSLHRSFFGSSFHTPPTNWNDYENLTKYATKPTDINDHLHRLFVEGVRTDPNTIVELGVRGGESTRVFSAVADRTGAQIVSVDIDPCDNATSYPNWQFVQSDDVEFANRWESWCEDNSVDSTIDLLFVDTSHLYDHTVKEVEVWLPKLAPDGVAIFHDTNLTRFYRRRDNSLGEGWDNDRGVIRALEDYFECSFDETEQFTTVIDDFLIEHYPLCNGLTVLTRLPDK